MDLDAAYEQEHTHRSPDGSPVQKMHISGE
jgi:hypothetical protein